MPFQQSEIGARAESFLAPHQLPALGGSPSHPLAYSDITPGSASVVPWCPPCVP